MKPNPGEPMQQFATPLRDKSTSCGYGNDTDGHIRDSIVWQSPTAIKRRLLEEGGDITLARALELATQVEHVENLLYAQQPAEPNVNRVQLKSKPQKGACYRCGSKQHYGNDPKCPAIGKRCAKCRKMSHFDAVCRTKMVNAVDESSEDYEEPPQTSNYAFHVDESLYKLDCMTTVILGGVQIDMLIDSGARTNVIDERTLKNLKNQKIRCDSTSTDTNSRKLYAYASKTPIPVKDKFTCTVKSGENQTTGDFLVIVGNGVPLLGKDTAVELDLLRVGPDVAEIKETQSDIYDQLCSEYSEIFDTVGKLKGTLVHLHIDESVTPVDQPLRRTPFHLRDRVENKLKQLEQLDIVEAVEGPTPLVNPVVIVPKGESDVRICLDMRQANQAIVRERHPIPTVEEVLQNMNGATIFSELDLVLGYHQLELDEESRCITTFVTHAGLHRYKRLLFGVNSASELFQYKISNAFSGINGVENISDNIVVHAADKAMHDERLRQVFQRLKSVGLTLNRAKCQFGMNKVKFFGYLVSEKGIGHTERRVQAVLNTRQPENINELRSFLGLVNYSARFIPEFARISEPLRNLTRNGVPFEFGADQMCAFNKLKECLKKANTLAHFDKSAPTQIIADGSPTALGAVLVQQQKSGPVVVSYASRVLSSVERRYSQTEREALSLVWACEKFHPYIYGKPFELVTDHKALEVIYGPKSKPSARIERWVLRMQPYDFKVKHVRGVDNIADSLSRLVTEPANETVDNADEYVRFVTVNATPATFTTKEIERESECDPELIELRNAITTGRFDNSKPYMPIAGKLCVIGQLVLRGSRIVMSTKLRPRTLALAHEDI